MIDPNSLLPITIINDEDYKILQIKDPPPYEYEDYDLLDPKEFKKFMTDLERIVRKSHEYSAMVSYLRDYMDMNECSFYENVSNKDHNFNIKIHLHHSPFTLYDICFIVYNKRSSLHESLDIEMIAKEVVYLHYTLYVGLIPLSETVHELVHNQYLFIPVQKVMGNFEKFFNSYEPYITPEIQDTYQRIIEFSKNYDETKQNEALAKNYIYLDIEGRDNEEEFNNTVDMMNSRIDAIKRKREDAIFNK